MAGRPWKYRVLIEQLPDDELFHVAKIVRYALDRGVFDRSLDDPDRELDAEEKRRARKNARSAIAQMQALKMPEAADGRVRVERPFEAYYNAWYGRTWKKHLVGDEE